MDTPKSPMTPTLLTVAGDYVNFLEPEGTRFDIEVIAHALSNICRFGGHTTAFYSVAQHSVLVSQIVSKPLELQALLHDGAEAFLGDVIKPLKVLLPNYSEIEDRLQRAIYKSFGICEVQHPDIKYADRVLLATERRDLMQENKSVWELTKGIKPLDQHIGPLQPQAAMRLFMDRYNEIMSTKAAAA